jgi:hypothetical protein
MQGTRIHESGASSGGRDAAVKKNRKKTVVVYSPIVGLTNIWHFLSDHKM